MKRKFNSDDVLSLEKTQELYNMVILINSVFHESTNINHMFS